MIALAPVRFSTMKDCPIAAVMSCAITRAMTSVGPPAAKPTMIRTGLAGKVCAWTAPTVASRDNRMNCLFMIALLSLIEPRRHHLAALDQPVLVGAVIGHRVVDRPDVLPHEDVALVPVERIAIFRPQLVLEQEGERFLAFLLGQLVDAHRVAGVGIEHLAPGERVRQEDRLRNRRLRLSLRFG